VSRLKQCRLCGAGPLELLHTFGQQPVAGYLEVNAQQARSAPRLELALSICLRCGLVQQAADDSLPLLMSKVYAHYQPTYGMSASVSTYLAEWARQAVADAELSKGEAVVEVGSNDGALLALLGASGFIATGFEPSLNLAQASADKGLEVRQSLFGTDAALRFIAERGPVQLVVTRHTLEHAADPRDFLRGIATILEPGGCAAIEVPDLRLQLEGNQFQSMTFQHTSIFSVRSLSAGLVDAGLSPQAVRFVNMDGGSMVITARKLAVGSAVPRQPDGALREEHDESAELRRYFTSVTAFCARTRELLSELKAQGARVIGYGAGSKGQAMINIIGLSAEELPMVIDDTPGNAGKFIPGTANEVVASSDPRARSADVILITAPTHAREIVDKERQRRDSGVRFLLTSPELHFAPG
jgi:methylation protein EvaC